MEDLKSSLKAYIEIDDQILEVNKQIQTLRSQRSEFEKKLIDVIKHTPVLEDKKKIDVNDGSYIRLINGYNKGWSMSKKDLKMYLDEYLKEKSEMCFEYIVEKQLEAAKTDEFVLERIKRK